MTSCVLREQTEETGGSKLSDQSKWEILLEGDYDLINYKDYRCLLQKTEYQFDKASTNPNLRLSLLMYDIKKQNFQTIYERDTLGTGSGEHLLINDLYLIDSYYDEETSVNKLLRINIETGEEEIIHESVSKYPFLFLSQLNEEEMVIFEPNKIEDNFIYTIEKYNFSTNEYVSLLETSYNKEKQEGVLITSVDCSNNHIYALVTENSIKYAVRVYNQDGELIQSIPFTELTEYLESVFAEDAVWKMEVIGKYFVFDTLGGYFYIYKLEDGGFEKIEQVDLRFYNMVQDISDYPENSEVLLFYKYGDSKGAIFDCEKETFIEFDISIDDECNRIVNIQMDQEGNVIFAMENQKLTDRKYYVTNKEVLVSNYGTTN